MTTSSKEYEEGRDAGLAGQTDEQNPYTIGTDEAMDWEDGRASWDADDED